MKICGYTIESDPAMANIAEARGIFRKRVAVGPRWEALPAGEQVAVVLHEIGHLARAHREKRWAMLPLLFLAPGIIARVTRAQELEADRFAVECCYGLELIAFLNRHEAAQSDFYPSSHARVQAIESMLGGEPC